MIPLPVVIAWKAIWRYRKLAAYGIAVLAVLLIGWRLHHHGVVSGRAEIQAAWDKDRASRAAVDATIAQNQAKVESANRARNEVIEREYQNKLAAIAADRDSIAGRVRQYESRLRSLSAAQATDQRGLDAIAGIAARQRELDAAFDAYDRSCRRDAVRFQALQDEIRPLL